MKPEEGDIKYHILITGQELEELQKFTWEMAESFGLDRRIDAYQGKRPIGVYRWDLECLEAVVSSAIEDIDEYPDRSTPEYRAIYNLYIRIKCLYEEAFNDP